jgi:hypothetical protein
VTARTNRPLTGAYRLPRPDGLDFEALDRAAPEELARFREATRTFSPIGESGGHVGLSWWLEQGSDFAASVLKRYRLFCHSTIGDVPLARSASYLALYALIGYESGLGYILRGYPSRLTRQQAHEIVAIAFQYCGPAGMERIARVWRTLSWPDAPSEPTAWPAGWGADPQAFHSGLDYSSPVMSRGEADRLRAWYRRWTGEVPPYVRLLFEQRSRVLKDHRNRFEHLVREIPKQVVPISMLHFSIQTRTPSGIREHLLLARGFGVSREYAVTTIHNALVYGGMQAASLVEEQAGDVLRAWPE